MQKNSSLKINLNFRNNVDFKPDMPELYQKLSSTSADIKKVEISDVKPYPSITISGDDFFIVLSNEIRVDTKRDIAFVIDYLNTFADICVDKGNKKITLTGFTDVTVEIPVKTEDVEAKFITTELKKTLNMVEGVDKSELLGLTFSIKEKTGERYLWYLNKRIKTRIVIRMPTVINLEYSDGAFKGFDELRQTVDKSISLSKKWALFMGFPQ